MTYSFFVPGLPVAKGSAKAFHHAHTGKIMVMQTNRDKQKVWVEAIQKEAIKNNIQMHEGSFNISLCFYFSRPEYHYSKGKVGFSIKANARPVVKPDLDKLIRCVLDALTGLAWKDDSQVILIEARKYWEIGRRGCNIIISNNENKIII